MIGKILKKPRTTLAAAFGAAGPGVVLSVCLLLVLLGWAGDSARDLIMAWAKDRGCNEAAILWVQIVGLLSVLFVLFMLVRKDHQKLRYELTPRKNIKPTPGLICFLSALPAELYTSLVTAFEAIEAGTCPDTGLSQFEKNSWGQNFKAINAHKDKLTHVRIIGSKESSNPRDGSVTPSSFKQVDLFRKIVNRYINSSIIIETANKPVDYEDLEALFKICQDNLDALEKITGGAGTVTIDITSGTKAATAAGVLLSTTRKRLMQYVGKDVTLWDIQPDIDD